MEQGLVNPMDGRTAGMLVEAAKAAQARAYAPYSRFRVGACLLGKSGTVYAGCNVENASYGLTCCAERVALFSAVARGEREFCALALAGGETGAAPPCGACLQALSEFCAPDMPVIMAGASGTETVSLGTLFPRRFSLAAREDA